MSLTEHSYLGMTAIEFAAVDVNAHNWMIERVCGVFGDCYKISLSDFSQICGYLSRASYSKSKFKRYLRNTFMYTVKGAWVVPSANDLSVMMSTYPRFKRELMALWNEYDYMNPAEFWW